MLNLSREDKLKLMRNLNWDYLDTHEDMLSVIEGNMESSGAFNRDKLNTIKFTTTPDVYAV